MAELILRSALAQDIARFVEFKEAVCGTVNKTRRWYMRSFDAYCAENGFASCCKDAVEGWGSAIEARQPGTPRSWTGPIRQFAKFLQSCGRDDAYVLPDSFGYVRKRVRPYLFSRHELDAFFAAAAEPEMNDFTWRWQMLPFFGLMHSCGLRTCEARMLAVGDVDLDALAIDVVGSKGGHSRKLYIDERTACALEGCKRLTDRRFGRGERTFFVSNTGRPVAASTVNYMFDRTWKQAGLPVPETGRKPRPYDLRHHFAYANIERWAAEGKDVNAMLPYLARYMGHSSIDATLYYVHTSPDFMAGYADAVRATEGLLPEVGCDG